MGKGHLSQRWHSRAKYLMRYFEIKEQTVGQKVWSATERRHQAMQIYQNKMRSIQQSTPEPKVGERQADAREKCQAAITKADDEIRNAVTPSR